MLLVVGITTNLKKLKGTFMWLSLAHNLRVAIQLVRVFTQKVYMPIHYSSRFCNILVGYTSLHTHKVGYSHQNHRWWLFQPLNFVHEERPLFDCRHLMCLCCHTLWHPFNTIWFWCVQLWGIALCHVMDLNHE
jgi:hypothetical protein